MSHPAKYPESRSGAQPAEWTRRIHVPGNGAAANGQPADDEMSGMKGRFLAVLNHEIRTPLSGIMGMTDLLLETRLDEEQQEYVTSARACAETLFEVLNATLEYSALTSGRVQLEEAEFLVQDTVQAAVAEHQFRADSKGLRLRATFGFGLPETVFGDALRVRQTISHLISNGVKFTPHGEVEVRVSAHQQVGNSARLRFEVRDTGIGIDQEHLHHIFDSFRQVDSSLSRTYSGLGLGLAIAERLTSLMDGTLWAESAVGMGSTFSAEFPFRRGEPAAVFQAAAAALSQANAAVPAAPVERTPVHAHILLVEDNDVAQRIFTHVLYRGNYLVDCASNGPEAMRMARERGYDLILMDLQMPVVDGIETTKAIRSLEGYQKVPVVALTANSAEEHRRLCLENGMQGFLTKPIPSEELLAAVAHHLRPTGPGHP